MDINTTTSATLDSYVSSSIELDTTDFAKQEEEISTSTIDHMDIIHCVILATIGLLAVCTNCLSFLIMFRCRWWHQKSIIILASLAVADIISGLTSPVLIYSWYLLPPTEYTLHNYLDAIIDFPVYASICNLALVGADRFIAINFPMKYHSLMSTRRLTIALVIIWSVSLIRFAILPFGVLSLTPEDAAEDPETTAAAAAVEEGVTLYTILECTVYFSLLLLIVHLYGRLWYIARIQERRIHALLVRDHSTQFQSAPSLKTSKANKTCGLILTAFVFCWVPFLTARLVEQARGVYDPDNMSVLLEFLLDFSKTSSFVNFFIYTWTSSRFRLAYNKILRCQANTPNIMMDTTEMSAEFTL